MEVIDDRMVDGECGCGRGDGEQIVSDFGQSRLETTQGGELFGDACGECGGGAVFDVS